MDANSKKLDDAFDPRMALRAAFVWKRLALAVFLTTTGIAALSVLRIKPAYESEASMIVRLGRESAGLDPTATTSEITPIYETREQELNSALEVMQSRKLLEAVIGVIGEDVVLNPTRFNFDAWQESLRDTTWPELDPEKIHRSNARHELAVEKIYKAVSLEVGRSSSVIGVACKAATPEMAQAITKTLVDAVQAEQVRLNETHGLDFFAGQVQMLQDKLQASRRLINDRKNELRVTTLEGERARLEDLLTAMEKELHILIPKLQGASAAVEVMTHEVASMPDRTQPNDATDMLRKKLHELQLNRATMLMRLTENHFRVQDVTQEIQLVEQQLQDPKNRNAANPTLRELEVTLAGERTKVAETEAQISAYREEISKIHTQLTLLNNAEAQMMALADREGELRAALTKATGKLEQARMLDELSREHISNIHVVQPATFNPVSISAPRSLVLIAGLLIGCVAAFVVPAVVEFGTWYLRTFRPQSEGDLPRPVVEEFIPCG